MRPANQTGLADLAEVLAGLFYLSMLVSLLAVLTASPGIAMGLLVLGACAHVARVGVEGLPSSRE